MTRYNMLFVTIFISFCILLILLVPLMNKTDETWAPTSAPTPAPTSPSYVHISSGYCSDAGVSSTVCKAVETPQICAEAMDILQPNLNQVVSYNNPALGMISGCSFATTHDFGITVWFQEGDTGTIVQCGQWIADSAWVTTYPINDYNPACVCDCRGLD